MVGRFPEVSIGRPVMEPWADRILDADAADPIMEERDGRPSKSRSRVPSQEGYHEIEGLLPFNQG